MTEILKYSYLHTAFYILITIILIPFFKDEIILFKRAWGIFLARSYRRGTNLILIFPGTVKEYPVKVVKRRIFAFKSGRGVWVRHSDNKIEPIPFELWSGIRILISIDTEFETK